MSIRPDPAREAGRASVLVLAAEEDDPARMLADRLGEAAMVVGPQDLSRPGWTYARNPCRRTGVWRRGPFRADDLTAVISLIPAVQPVHLPHVRPLDRDYVAAEMTAFLRAWLGGLSCPVVNPPTATCLSGPALTAHQWVTLCGRMSIPTQPAQLAVPAISGSRPTSAAYHVMVCRGTTTAARPCSAVLLEHSRRLAAQVRAEWLAVTFDGGHDQAVVCQVETWPDLTDPSTLEALAQALAHSEAGS